MIKKLFLFFLLIIFSATLVLAVEPEYPAYKGFVNDFSGTLGPAVIQKIEALSRELEQKTSAEMAIAVVKSVAPLDSKSYAVKLFEKWKIGKKGKDNGILLLVALQERRVEIEVGYGLEGVINDAKAGAILDNYVVPFFKRGEVGEGIYNGAAALANEIGGEAGKGMGVVSQPKAEQKAAAWEEWIVPGMIVIIIVSLSLSGLAAGLIGAIFGAILGFSYVGIIGAIIGALIGFVITYSKIFGPGGFGGFFGGGGFGGGGGGGGFGGFGGGGSGGGGSGRDW